MVLITVGLEKVTDMLLETFEELELEPQVDKGLYSVSIYPYQDGRVRGQLTLIGDPPSFYFSYFDDAQGSIPISETGNPISKLNNSYVNPTFLEVQFKREHYHLLRPLTEPRIPPSVNYLPELEHVEESNKLKIYHDFSSDIEGPDDHVCLAMDPHIAYLFPRAHWQEKQEHFCIDGPLGSVIPEGFEEFDEISLYVIDPSTRERPWKHLNGLILPEDVQWDAVLPIKCLFQKNT